MLNEPVRNDFQEILSRNNLPAVLETKEFIERLKEKYYEKSCDNQVPQSVVLAPAIVQIKQVVERAYHVTSESLEFSRRGLFNEPRNVAIYLSRKYSGKKLLEIGKEFNFNSYSSASSIVEKMRKLILKGKKGGKEFLKLSRK